MNFWQFALAIIGFKIYSNKDFKPNIKYFLAPPNECDINDIKENNIHFANYDNDNDNNNNFVFKTTYRFRC